MKIKIFGRWAAMVMGELVVAIVLMGLSATPCWAPPVSSWSDNSSGYWDEASKWGGSVPSGVIVNVNTGNGNAVTIRQNEPNIGTFLAGISSGSGYGHIIMDGGSLTTTYSSGSSWPVSLGYGLGTTGVFDMAGGALTIGSDMYIGYASTSTGTFNQSGGTAIISAALKIGYGSASTGTYYLRGGTLKANSISFGPGSGTFTFTGGKLSVGTYNGTLDVKSGATIAPGSSPGTEIINGSALWETGGAYDWEINLVNGTKGADPGWDWVSVTGSPGTLTIQDDFEFHIAPEVGLYFNIGDSFIVASAVGGITLLNDATPILKYESTGLLASDWGYFLSNSNKDFNLQFNGSSGGVPEPATVVGLVGVIIVIGFRRIRRK